MQLPQGTWRTSPAFSYNFFYPIYVCQDHETQSPSWPGSATTLMSFSCTFRSPINFLSPVQKPKKKPEKKPKKNPKNKGRNFIYKPEYI